MANRGLAPLHALKVLQICKNAGACPLPSFSRQGRRAQLFHQGIPRDSRTLSGTALHVLDLRCNRLTTFGFAGAEKIETVQQASDLISKQIDSK